MGAPAGPRTAGANSGMAAGGPRHCHQCGAELPTGFKFCGQCGSKQPDGAPAPRGTADIARQPAREERPKGKLILIRPDGSEGGTHELGEGENKIGRSFGAIFENDGYLSPTHAELVVNVAGAVIRDLDSLNGVFVRMTEEEEVQAGQIIRIGQELLRYDVLEQPAPLEDGTEVMGSPNPGYWGKLSIIIGSGVDGSAYPLLGDSVTLGRERGDINFPDDGYVSGLHARLSTRNGRAYLADLGSSNGTFVKVADERAVRDGSFVLLGQQLFRIGLRS
jgi:pSer/pThr/pTyr-binding forkhead associated (FHA) protein